MRKPSFAVIAFAALTLSGCAGMGTKAARDSLAPLQLFDAQSRPRFAVYLACGPRTSDEAVQCATVSRVFDAWHKDRRVEVREIGADDPLFSSGRPSADAGTATGKPLRLGIRYDPVVVPSFDRWSGTSGTMTSGFVPGRVGYEVTLYVFSTASGALVRKLTLHDQVAMPQYANVTPAIKAGAREVIRQIDPAYSNP